MSTSSQSVPVEAAPKPPSTPEPKSTDGEEILKDKQGPVEERGFTFRMLLKDQRPVAIPFIVEGTASPYDFCLFVLRQYPHAVERAELVDAFDAVMMYYEPARGWYFGDGKDQTLPSFY